MSSPRLQILLTGAGLALVAGLLVDQGSHLGADLPHAAVLGIALGAVIGLVPDSSLAGRMLGFGAGFIAAWLGYALRAGVLPDIAMGRAIAAVIVIGIVTLLAAGTSGWVPLWSGLIGAGALVGAYETTFAALPTSFVDDSTAAATSVLLAAALGLLITSTVMTFRPAPHEEAEDVPLDALMLPGPRASADASVEEEAQR
jgi:hypothetical protein